METVGEGQLTSLTWNISTAPDLPGVSARAPASWTVADNLAALAREVRRLSPDVLALQECPGEDAVAALGGAYSFLGSAPSHSGFVHLYAREGVGCRRLELPSGLPAVAGESRVGDLRLQWLAVHLSPGKEGAARRRRQLARALAALDGCTVAVLGDFNVREEEVEVVCRERSHKTRIVGASRFTRR